MNRENLFIEPIEDIILINWSLDLRIYRTIVSYVMQLVFGLL
jgi:hypothetical protein